MAGNKTTAKNAHRAGKRRCRRCKEVWYRSKGDLSNTCPTCQNQCVRCACELEEENRSQSYAKQNYAICKPCCVERSQLRNNKPGQKEINRDRHLVRTYGITVVEYDAILAEQKGACWICKNKPKKGQRRLAIDHRHVKNDKKQNPRKTRTRVRGLLCWNCNAAIGKFNDNIANLRAAADYLEQLPAQKVLKEKSNG